MSEQNQRNQNSAANEQSDDDSPAKLHSPDFHLAVLNDLVYEAEISGAVPLASYPENRYPYVYPRDTACITRAWLAALRANIEPELCTSNLLNVARFMVDVQEENGQWQQRYDLDGNDTGIYIQEDNIGHGLHILSHATAALHEQMEFEGVSSSFIAEVVTAIDAAVTYTTTSLFDPNAHLIESTTSIHEGRIESGYTLWVNCVFVAGLRQAKTALENLPPETELEEDRITTLLGPLEAGVERAFTTLQQVPRRYSPTGEVDTRPDVTLFAPHYFGLKDIFGQAASNAAARAAEALKDPQLGGLQRFMGFYQDYEVQQHGGNGPWMQYTAWHAQFCYQNGDESTGDEILDTIKQYSDENGHIPEHLTRRERFESFMENEWNTRKDFEKEFDEAVLRDVPFDAIVDEAQSMRDSYQRLAKQVQTDDVVGFARPLAWCHAEVLTALLCRNTTVELPHGAK